jgi:DNA-directed RNA polymerase alpha subunit
MSTQKVVYTFDPTGDMVKQLEEVVEDLRAIRGAGFKITEPFPENLEFQLVLKKEAAPPNLDEQRRAKALNKNINEFEMSVRTYNCLINANILTVRALVQKTEAEVLKVKNLGRKGLNEIKAFLGQEGLSLGMKLDPPYEND